MNVMQRILMIDDDTELCEMMTEYLTLEGFSVTAENDGESGVQRASGDNFDLILLDVMLPRLNGFEVLRRIRATTQLAHTPVLMLTARGDAVDRIVGLEVGADDYLPKPFDERELVARMRAILRRTQRPTEAAPTRGQIVVGDLLVDEGARIVRCNNGDVALTAAEFDLLVLLVREAGSVVEREVIAKRVLDRELLPFDRSIDTHVSHLRRKLGPHPDGSERFKTVRGVGYIYALPAR
jgi:two-component system response regulator CpxR